MADGLIQVPVDSTGKKVDTTELTVGANTVERQRVQLGGDAATDLAKVDATKGLRVDLANTGANATALKVDGSAVTQPVSGTFFQATQPVSIAAAVPVTDNAGSLTVDGAVSASNLPSTVDTNSGNKSASTLRVVLATDQPALTNKLLVTPDSVALPANQSVNAAQLAGTTTDTNSGNKSAGTLRVVIATDQPALTNKLLVTPDAVTHDVGSVTTAIVPGTGATNLGKAEDAAHSSGDVGVMALGVRASSPTERSAGPTDGDYEPLGVNEVGALWVSVTPSANGGATTMNASSSDGATALTNTAQVIKASAGTLKGYYIYNPNATAQFVLFYNTAAASVTVGTTNPLFMLTIPATSAANLWMTDGIAFSNAGWSWAAASTAGGNGAPGTALDAIAWYK